MSEEESFSNIPSVTGVKKSEMSVTVQTLKPTEDTVIVILGFI